MAEDKKLSDVTVRDLQKMSMGAMKNIFIFMFAIIVIAIIVLVVLA